MNLPDPRAPQQTPIPPPASRISAQAPSADVAHSQAPSADVAHSKAPSADVALTRMLAVGSLLGLIALGLAWELWLAPLRPGGSWLVLKVLPLCIPLAGLLKNRMYTYRWVSLLVWLYFTEGVVRGWGDKPPGNWLGLLEVALCLSLFTACAMHVRLRLRHAKEAALAGQAAISAAETLSTAFPATPATPPAQQAI